MGDDDRRSEIQNQNRNSDEMVFDNSENANQSKALKWKSCKGCLYYSSSLSSNSQNPVCVGVPRTMVQVRRFNVEAYEAEVAKKASLALRDFKYACVGYSLYMDNKDSKHEQPGKRVELPFCHGFEAVLDRQPSTSDHAPTHARNKEVTHTFLPPRTYKPAGDEYFNRFKRSAGLVASGVAKNVNKVGNYVKERLEDILYPYRRK